MQDLLINKEQLTKSFPKSVRDRITDDILLKVNDIANDDMVRDTYRNNLLGYAHILTDSRYKVDDYINACKYVAFKLLGHTNYDAFVKTFPERMKKMMEENTPDGHIYSYASGYNKTQLVNKILEQTLVPTYILNLDIHQKAINVQADLMMNAKSEKVRSDAANSLLTHLKRPETTKIELDIGIKEDSSINDLRSATMELVKKQRELLESGLTNIKEVAGSRIIEGEVEDV